MGQELGSATRSLWEYAEFYIEALVALVVAWSFFIFIHRNKLRILLPPGPFPLPVIGNLHLLGKLPHQALAALSLKYGNISMSEVLRNPRVLQKLQDELARVVGMERMVCESDLPSLVYLQAVVKETLRLHPVVPFPIHLSLEDCTVLGYEIPINTRIFFNLWAIGRNPKSWGQDAQSFKPERFLIEAEAGLIHKTHENFEWLPFGAGRRGCPGQQLGTLLVELAVAQLLHCFNWRLPLNEQELDMTEMFNGLTLPRANELFALPTPRLPVL